MSMTFYCYRPDASQPLRSHGPLTEIDDEYHGYHWDPNAPRTLDPSIEQEIEAGWFNGPNLSNSNAAMVVRSLGYDSPDDGSMTFDPAELLGRVTMGRACPPIDDGGMPDIRVGNMTACGVRPGYFSDRYAGIAEVCEQALAWGVEVVLA